MFALSSWAFVWVYLLSPSCDNGSNGAVHGGNSSGGQQYRGSALRCDGTTSPSCLLAEGWTASADRPTAPDQQGRHSAPRQSTSTMRKTPVWKCGCVMNLFRITLTYMFQLLSVQVSDMAGYLCVAENKVGSVEKLFSLTVQGKTFLLSSL